MKTIEIKGVIVLNDYKEVYEWFGYECTCPNDVIAQLPEDASPIEVIINSGGGHVDAGNEIYARLKGYQGEVTTKTYSLAASAASIIAMASNNGGKTLIAPTAQFMIHNVSGLSEGDYRAHVKEAQVLENYNKAIATAYTLKTGKTDEEILQMMNEETWLNAQQAVEFNFADGILFEEKTQLVASTNIAMLPQSVVDKARQMMKVNTGIISNDQLDYIVNQVSEKLKQNNTLKNEPSKRRGFIF